MVIDFTKQRADSARSLYRCPVCGQVGLLERDPGVARYIHEGEVSAELRHRVWVVKGCAVEQAGYDS